MNVEVEIVSGNSLRVSWDTIDIPEVTGYIVYYSQTGEMVHTEEESATMVHSSVTALVITGLMNNVKYHFQVVAIAELDGDMVTGERSMPTEVLVVLVVAKPAGMHIAILRSTLFKENTHI